MLDADLRLLELLELLQTRPLTTGREIADRLGIDRRTVRRYIAALQELGIPVEGQRGVGGGYRMRPGYRLPPLMLDDDEAVVVVLGLVAARRLGLESASRSVDGALAKIHRVLPDALRRRVEALETTLGFTDAATAGAPVAGDAVLLLAEAIRRRRRVRTALPRRSRARRRERELSPHGLVVHAGRWYLAAHDHARDDLRTFRVDRMRRARGRRRAPPWRPGRIRRGRARQPLARARALAVGGRGAARPPARRGGAARFRATLAELVEADGGTLLRMRVSSLDWMAGVLAGLGCAFTIRRPDELRASVLALAERLAKSA